MSNMTGCGSTIRQISAIPKFTTGNQFAIHKLIIGMVYTELIIVILIIIILNKYDVAHSPTTLNEPAVRNPPGSDVRKRQTR